MNDSILMGYGPNNELRKNILEVPNVAGLKVTLYSGPAEMVLNLAKNLCGDTPELKTACNRQINNIDRLSALIVVDSAKTLDQIDEVWNVYTRGKKNEADYCIKMEWVGDKGILVFDTRTAWAIGTVHDHMHGEIGALLTGFPIYRENNIE